MAYRKYNIPKVEIVGSPIVINENRNKNKFGMNNRKPEFSDSILSEFTDLQKEFIINEIYPSLKQALMHVSKQQTKLSIHLLTGYIFIPYTSVMI